MRLGAEQLKRQRNLKWLDFELWRKCKIRQMNGIRLVSSALFYLKFYNGKNTMDVTL